MAIAQDWLEPTETQDASETQFIDRLLEGWARWVSTNGVNLQPTPVGFLWRIPNLIIIGHELVLSDDGFTLIDQRIAILPGRLRGIVFIEYRSQGTSEQKAKRIGLNRLGYRQRLHAAQWTLFASLGPAVDLWRQKSI